MRRAVPGDVGALVELERRSFADPWSEASFRESIDADGTFSLLAEADDGIVGYLIAREAGGVGEILNLAVAAENRRAGIARLLLTAALAELATRVVEEVFLEVRESNVAARSLYERDGFHVVGQRAAYYRSPREDALVLRRPLGAGAKR